MGNILSVALGAGPGLTGAVFGSWFTARRQDRDGREDRRAHHRETLELLRRFTHQLRQEIVRP